MMAAGFGFDPAFNLGPGNSTPGAGGAQPGGMSPDAAGGAPGSFSSLLHAVVSGSDAAAAGGKTFPPADRSAEELPADPSAGQMAPPSEVSQEDGPAWSALAQLIQGMIARVDAPAEAMDPEEAPDSDPDTEDQGFLRFIDLLKQLEAFQAGDAPEAGVLLKTLHGLLAGGFTETGGGSTEAGAGSQGGVAGRLRQWLVQVQDAVPGGAWGRLAQLIMGQGAGNGIPLRPPQTGETGPIAAGRVAWEALASVALGREAMSAGQPDAGQNHTARPGVADVKPHPADFGGGSTPAGTRPVTAPAASLDPPRSPETPVAAPARDAALTPGHGGAAVSEAARSGSSQPQVVSVGGGGEDEAAAGTVRDARSAAAPEPAADRIAAVGGGAKAREAAAHGAKPDVADQIVQRAAVLLKSDRGEARIDLKPEFLGQVRMHIVTDNQLVTVRILTESPMVRDLIEHNLHQLKSDLQQQGLQVERVEVFVSDDPRRNAGRHARRNGGQGGRGLEAGDGAASGAIDEQVLVTPADWGAAGRSTISMFA